MILFPIRFLREIIFVQKVLEVMYLVISRENVIYM